MTDEDGEAWLDEHMHRAEALIWIFYALVALSAIAIAAPINGPSPLCRSLWRWFYSARSPWGAGFISATLVEEFVIVNFETNQHHRKDPNTENN